MFLAPSSVMRNRMIIATSTMVAGAVVIALILRPSHSIPPRPALASPEHIAPAARVVIHSRMERHGEQLAALVSRVVVLDYDGAARAAGEIYDEPTLTRPLAGDELNGVLPERFFVLQGDLRAEARRLVTAAARKDSGRLAGELGALTKSCIACHDLYLHGSPDVVSR